MRDLEKESLSNFACIFGFRNWTKEKHVRILKLEWNLSLREKKVELEM